MNGDKAVEVVPSCGTEVGLGSRTHALHGAIVVVWCQHHVNVRVDLGCPCMEQCVPGYIWVTESGEKEEMVLLVRQMIKDCDETHEYWKLQSWM